MCEDFDTVTLCLSKGLGCPVGSVIMGNEEDISDAKRYREILGGNIFQTDMYARAGLEALDLWPEKLAADHANAQLFGHEISKLPYFDIDTSIIETNILRFSFKPDMSINYKHDEFVKLLKTKYGILMKAGFQNESLAICTH